MGERYNPGSMELSAQYAKGEASSLEEKLARSEMIYGKDIYKLQQALLRTWRIGILHLVLLHLKLYSAAKASMRLPLEAAFYKWKGTCGISRKYRVKKVFSLVRHLYMMRMLRTWAILKERASRAPLESIVDGHVYNHGAMPPISFPEEDSPSISDVEYD